MTDVLKPCPFCGGEVKSEVRTMRDSYGFYKIMFFKCQSKKCGAIVSFNSAKTYKDYMLAVEAWNRRIGDDKSKDA